MDRKKETNSQKRNQLNAETASTQNFIAPNATVVGDVTIGSEATVWFQAVLRGDANYIRVGERTNIQDGTIIHVDHDAPTIIAEDVTVGHQCMLHGCKIEKGALIGMSSIVLNHAVIGENSLIGAGSSVDRGRNCQKQSQYRPLCFLGKRLLAREICLLMASEVNRISFNDAKKPACFSTAGFLMDELF